MKRRIIEYICLFYIASISYANERNLLEDFNNNVTLFTKLDSNDLRNYIPSIQLATNDKSPTKQEWIEDILYIEKLLFQWSNRLSNRYSGHYWVLMTKEDKKPSLVNIAKVRPTTTIQSPNITMEIVIDDKREKYDAMLSDYRRRRILRNDSQTALAGKRCRMCQHRFGAGFISTSALYRLPGRY